MANLNRYKFTFGEKQLTLTTEHDNLFMEEIERIAQENTKLSKKRCRRRTLKPSRFCWQSMLYPFN